MYRPSRTANSQIISLVKIKHIVKLSTLKRYKAIGQRQHIFLSTSHGLCLIEI